MKSINNYISEKLVINRNTKLQYKYFPETKHELVDIIEQRIKEEGNACSLNDIDVSKIDNMSNLFFNSKFNGDISEWDVSNVKNMGYMFNKSKFNGDISQWDVSNVKYMNWMFAQSEFNQDISKWNVSNVTDMTYMFTYSDFNQDISNWEININKTDITDMFKGSPIAKRKKMLPKVIQ